MTRIYSGKSSRSLRSLRFFGEGMVKGIKLLALFVVVMIALTAVLTPGLRPETAAAPVPDLSPYPWVYLRDGQPLVDDETVMELIAVGDVMLGRGVADETQPLADVASWLAAADLTLGNLESVIVQDGTPRTAPAGEPQPIILQAPLTAVSHLTSAGFDILSLANNHGLDFGPDGLAETAVRLQEAGISPVGAGPDFAAAYQPLLREVNGLHLAFLAFNAIPEPEQLSVHSNQWQYANWDEVRAIAAVAQAKERADVVIVSMHWGYEYEQRADPGQTAAADALLAAGADLVVGHHPHVVQALALNLQGFSSNQWLPTSPGFVAYSLGNFVFDQGLGETNQGLALRAFFDAGGLRAVQALPVWSGPRPRLMTLAEAEPLLARIQPPPPRAGFACAEDACQPVAAPKTAVSGIFWSGAIDLTGDGQDEIIRRAGERVTIYQKTCAEEQRSGGAEENITPASQPPCSPALTEVYTTPPEWRVVDAALGDPNDDGRYELLLAIWQTDATGHDRSQPYIVGYRGGAYQLLWGGRPLARPISEVALGDVDGDGRQELVSVEEDAVAVWRWQGWNFSLLWRSANGRYRDLVLVEENGRTLLSVATGD